MMNPKYGEAGLYPFDSWVFWFWMAGLVAWSFTQGEMGFINIIIGAWTGFMFTEQMLSKRYNTDVSHLEKEVEQLKHRISGDPPEWEE